MKRAIALAVTLTFLAGCSGGGLNGGNLLPGMSPAARMPAGGLSADGRHGMVDVQVTMRIPKRHRREHVTVHPSTISPMTRSVSFVVNGGAAQVFNATTSSSNCKATSSGTQCTFAVKAAPGTDSFIVTTYSAANGTGTALDRAVATINIVAGKANAPVIHLGPVVSNALDTGLGSLRYAIGSSNPGDTVLFTIAKTSTITLASPLSINSNVSIAGPGTTAAAPTHDGMHENLTVTGLAINGAGTQQLFVVQNGVKVTISGLVLKNGSATTSNQPGGAVYNAGALTLTNDVLETNDSQVSTSYIVRVHATHQNPRERAPRTRHPHVVSYHYGGAVYNHGSLVVTGTTFYANAMTNVFNSQWTRGGAIYNDNYGTLVSTGNHYTNNSAYEGGAVYNNSSYGSATFTSDVFTGNNGCNASTGCAVTTCSGSGCATYPTGYGGAIYDNNGPGVTITSSAFTSNFVGGIANDSAGDGGALALESGAPNVSNSTFTGNLAGGGIADCSYGYGGAIYENASNALELDNDVFTGNKAAGDDYGYGGAVYNESNPDNGSNNTFTSNQAIGSGSACQASGEAAGGALYAEYGITMSGSKFTSNVAKANYDAWGGAVSDDSDPATLTSDTFTSNSAVGTGLNGASASYAYGGALYVDNTLRLSTSTLSSNSATAESALGTQVEGGAIYSDSNFTSSSNSFSSNSATVPSGTGSVSADGGAVYAGSSSTYISNGDKFTSNSASAKKSPEGGAVYVGSNYGLTNATFTSNKVTATASGGESYGGALGIEGTGVVSTSAFTSNSSTSTSPGSAYEHGGGAIYDDATTTFNGVKVTGNTVTAGSGGGMMVYGGTNVVNSSTFSGNTATVALSYGGGGGIYLYDGTLAINNSTLSGNTAAVAGGTESGGGGFYNDDGAVVTGTTISGNKVTGTGTSLGGGGVYNYYEPGVYTNDTITGNASSGNGGGFVNDGYPSSGVVSLNNVTMYENTATGSGGNFYNNDTTTPYITLANTIIAGGKVGATNSDVYNTGTVVSNDYNLFGMLPAGGGTLTLQSHDKRPSGSTPLSPLLLGLSNNGGPTFTNADQSTSPGKSWIPWSSASGGTCGSVTGLSVDQRNFSRGAGAKCDIGAYEFSGAPSTVRVHVSALPPRPRKAGERPHVRRLPPHERLSGK